MGYLGPEHLLDVRERATELSDQSYPKPRYVVALEVTEPIRERSWIVSVTEFTGQDGTIFGASAAVALTKGFPSLEVLYRAEESWRGARAAEQADQIKDFVIRFLPEYSDPPCPEFIEALADVMSARAALDGLVKGEG